MISIIHKILLQLPFGENILAVLRYMHANAWTIVFTVLGAVFVKNYVLAPSVKRFEAWQTDRFVNDPDRVSRLEEDRRAIRERQQAAAEVRAREAQVEEKVKKGNDLTKHRIPTPEEERRRHHFEALQGRRLGGQDDNQEDAAGNDTDGQTQKPKKKNTTTTTVKKTNSRGGGYNPLDPSSGSTSNYRPTGFRRPGGGG